jgi:hypothetical protein
MAGLHAFMYDPRLVQPMREELTRIGFQELRTPPEVDAALADTRSTTLVVVNSVCGCAAGKARPAAAYFTGYPPSSPQMALFKDGKLVFMLERRDIEGRAAPDIAADLVAAFDRYC